MSGAHAHGPTTEEVADRSSPVHRLDPRVKIVGLVGLAIVSATTPTARWGAFATYLVVLAALAALARLPLRFVLTRMTVEVPFLVAAAALVVVADDGGRLGATLALKITVGVLAMVVLAGTTPFPRVLQGFERLGAPRTIMLVVAFMWRSMHLVVADAQRARQARAARGYDPRWLWQAGPIARGTATLFVRSIERGERVYQAMLARGYAGGLPVTATVPLAIGRADVAAGLLLATTVVLGRGLA